MQEQRCALRDVHGAKLSGPLEDVLEQPVVEGLQVREIEVARHGTLSDLLPASPGGFVLSELKLGVILDAELVPQHCRAGVRVRVDELSHVCAERRRQR